MNPRKNRIIGVTTQEDLARALREVAELPGSGVHHYVSIGGGHGLVAETLEGLARDLLDRLQVWRPTHRHYRGGEYRELGACRVERSPSVPMTLYEAVGGALWVRPTSEFGDTVEVPTAEKRRRFTPLAGPGSGEPVQCSEARTISAEAEVVVSLTRAEVEALARGTVAAAEDDPDVLVQAQGALLRAMASQSRRVQP